MCKVSLMWHGSSWEVIPSADTPAIHSPRKKKSNVVIMTRALAVWYFVVSLMLILIRQSFCFKSLFHSFYFFANVRCLLISNKFPLRVILSDIWDNFYHGGKAFLFVWGFFGFDCLMGFLHLLHFEPFALDFLLRIWKL